MVDATESDVSELKKSLIKQGFSITAFGRSSRPASDGVQYAYYIRLGNGPTEQPTKDEVRGALGVHQALGSPPVQPATADAELHARLDDFQGRIESMSNAIEDIRSSTAQAQERQYHHAKTTSTDLRNLQRVLSRTAEQIEQVIVTTLHNRIGDSEQLEQLKAQLAKYREDEGEWQQMDDARKKEIDQLQDQVEELRAANNALKSSAESRGTRSSGSIEPREMFKILLPQVEFLRGSMDILLVQTKDPHRVLRDIERIAHGAKDLKAKRVASASNWQELRFSMETGRESGRLYFCRSGEKVQVLLSTKQEQEQDIEYLKRS